jgi:Ca2+-binding RTX toxin-like protein
MLASAALLAAAFAPQPASAALLSTSGTTVYYQADPGEQNDVLVGAGSLLGQSVFTFTDNDAIPMNIGTGMCAVVNGVGMCPLSGLAAIVVDTRDQNDSIQVATAGSGGLGPPHLPATLIGGDGNDELMGGIAMDTLKGGNGRDSLRGRLAADWYKGGRGSDTLQTLDGTRDGLIVCGEGGRDLLRADKLDPRPRRCELGGRKPSKKF